MNIEGPKNNDRQIRELENKIDALRKRHLSESSIQKRISIGKEIELLETQIRKLRRP